MNFLHCEYLNSPLVCDSLIEYHKKSEHKGKGRIGLGIDPNQKDSTDVILQNSIEKTNYYAELTTVVNNYKAKFSFCNNYAPWTISEPVNIQHYSPGQCFFVWHSENTNKTLPNAYRMLVFMTYLNDVTDEGGTEWFYQKIKLQPKKGLTAIWPADWTYTHRGIPSPSQDKYIVTGWFSYI